MGPMGSTHLEITRDHLRYRYDISNEIRPIGDFRIRERCLAYIRM